ncbi:MAG: metallophosphoesterase family protein [Candidatus Dormibacteraeota bacterium]|nr:metallophosphoesterase family protein [Candidatus Dormibacteraeota bacterium]
MRIAVVGDIHGNLPALEAVIADAVTAGVDEMWCQGDICHGGPWPREALDLVIDRCSHITQGDVDRANVEAKPWANEAEKPLWEAAEFVRTQVGTCGLSKLASLPEVYRPPERPGLTMRHAGPLSGVVPRIDAPEEAWLHAFGYEGGDFVFGHRHEAGIKRVAGMVLVCTGSVGAPFDGDPRAAYVVLDLTRADLGPTHRRVDYDRESTAREFERIGPVGAWMARGIRQGVRAPAPWMALPKYRQDAGAERPRPGTSPSDGG